jgi:hypothetical protein
MLTLAQRYGKPDRVDMGKNRSDPANRAVGRKAPLVQGGQYIKASRDEHEFTIGSESLDVEK